MPEKAEPSPDIRYQPFLFWFGFGALVWITLLLYAGGVTTTIRAGMAFLDWPLSNGSINPDGWLDNRDMTAEHSHRLLAMVMGLASIGLCVTAFCFKVRRQVRLMGVGLVFMVVFQGVLGGLRVLLDKLNLGTDSNVIAQSFAVSHATVAQIYLCLLVAFVLSNSRLWLERNAGFREPASPSLHRWGLIACATIVLQLIVGAIMRHAHAGLAIPTFPLTPQGTIVPPVFTFPVAIHFAHRVGAVIVTIAIVAYCVAVWRDRNSRRALGKSAAALLALLVVQALLGIMVIETIRNEHVTTLHMLNGALTLAVCWAMTFRSLKAKIDPFQSRVSPSERSRGAGVSSLEQALKA